MVLYISIYVYVRRKFKTFNLASSRLTVERDVSKQLSDFTLTPPAGNHIAPLRTYDLVTEEEESRTQSRRPSVGFLIDGEINVTPQEEKQFTSSSKSSVDTPMTSAASSPRKLSLPTLTRTATDLQQDDLQIERARIVKQLKHLFVFPLVYFIMWIIPFCLHLTQYFDQFVHSPVIGLSCASAFIIPIHGFIDVLVYARNERPWRSWNRGRRSSLDEEDGNTDMHNRLYYHDSVAARQLAEVREAQTKKKDRLSERSMRHGSKTARDWFDFNKEDTERI